MLQTTKIWAKQLAGASTDGVLHANLCDHHSLNFINNFSVLEIW